MDNKLKLKQAFDKFKGGCFPLAPQNNIFSEEIHSDLVLFDSYVAGTISKILKNKEVTDSELLFDDDLEVRIKDNIVNLGEHDAVIANSYLQHMKRLKGLINEAKLSIGLSL